MCYIDYVLAITLDMGGSRFSQHCFRPKKDEEQKRSQIFPDTEP